MEASFTSNSYFCFVKVIIRSLGAQVLFWLLFFAFNRGIFLIYYHDLIGNESTLSIVAVFWHAIRLDISTISYFMCFPLIWSCIQCFVNRNWMNKVVLIYHSVLIFLYATISAGELGLYSEWQTKLNYKALQYLLHPSEVYGSVSTREFILLSAILLSTFAAGFFAFKRWFFPRIGYLKCKKIFIPLFFLVSASLITIGLRGGIQQIPINQSVSYFSTNNTLNLASVNSGWNIIFSIHQNYYSLSKNPFHYYDDQEAKKITDELNRPDCDSSNLILKTKRPNIILIILEGWCADVIESLGGHKGITPNFHELEKGGILFTRFYASGSRSEQGMSSIFGGFPSTPLAQITRQPDKFVKLPSLTKVFADNGYSTSFFFGGDLSYGNIRSYMYYNKFSKVYEEGSFDASCPRGKLGVHDEVLFPFMISTINVTKEPFFDACFTLSTHTPYDVPGLKEKLSWPEYEKEYINAVNYSDSCIGAFIHSAKKQSWYKNTLFVLVSDHGHGSYQQRASWSPEYNQIPLLLSGEVIQDSLKGSQVKTIGSQYDLPATLLKQCGLPTADFHWSKDLFTSCYKHYAFYEFEVGLGWVSTAGSYIYDHNSSSELYNDLPPGKSDSIKKAAKAYLQQLYEEYRNY